MYTHYRGTSFQFVGQMQDDGDIQDLTNCHLIASVFDPTGDTLYGNLTVSIYPGTAGLVQLGFGDTSAWPPGRARVDMLLTLPDGSTVASAPSLFRIEQTPMVTS